MKSSKYKTIKRIGMLIRKQRKTLGHSIEQLAEYSSISLSTISRIELDKIKNIHFSTLFQILETLGLQFNIHDPEAKITPAIQKLFSYLK